MGLGLDTSLALVRGSRGSGCNVGLVVCIRSYLKVVKMPSIGRPGKLEKEDGEDRGLGIAS